MLESKCHCPMGASVDLLLTLAAPGLIATVQTKTTRDTLRATAGLRLLYISGHR